MPNPFDLAKNLKDIGPREEEILYVMALDVRTALRHQAKQWKLPVDEYMRMVARAHTILTDRD